MILFPYVTISASAPVSYIYPRLLSLTWLYLRLRPPFPPLALGASNVCLVGENPTCSIPAW